MKITAPLYRLYRTPLKIDFNIYRIKFGFDSFNLMIPSMMLENLS